MRVSLPLALFSFLVVGSLVLTGCGPSDGDGGDDSSSTSDESSYSDDSSSSSTSDSTAPLNVTVEWGSLKGRFVYDGTAPAQSPVNMGDNKDAPYCGEFNPLDESLVVNSANGGVRDVVIYLRDETDKVHTDYESTASDLVLLNNEHCRFVPHICLLRTSQTLGITNKDTVGHNTKIDPFDNPPFNKTVPAKTVDDPEKVNFTKQETRPTNVSCSIHPWMNAVLVIRENPYFAVTDENGEFEIKNLPGGKWSMQVWHQKAGYVDEVKIDGASVKWSKGRKDAIIDDGDDDWGEVKLPPALFEK